MLVDADGKPVEPKAQAHRFGVFVIPDDCHVSFGIDGSVFDAATLELARGSPNSEIRTKVRE